MWWLVTAALACEQPLPMASLDTLMSDFEGAFARRDVDRLDSTHAILLDSLPCVDEGLLPDAAARIHRIQGMAAFLDDERQVAAASFRAARSLDPEHTLSVGLVGAAHPMRALYEGLQPSLTTKTLDPPASGWLTLDGRRTRERPEGVPTILQHLDDTGQPQFTAYVDAYAPTPVYETEVPTNRTSVELELGVLVLGGTSRYGKIDQTFAGGLLAPLTEHWALRVAASLSLAPEYRDDRLGLALLPAIELGVRRTGPVWVEPMVGLFFNDDEVLTSFAGGARVGIHRVISERVGWTASVGGGVITGHTGFDLSPFGQLRVGLDHQL